MPVQKFAPMNKDYATFDCDAHIVEPTRIWERAADHLTMDELEALKATIWWDSETKQLIVNRRADVNGFSPVPRGGPGSPGPASSMTFNGLSMCVTSILRPHSPRSSRNTSPTPGPTSLSPGSKTWMSRALTR